MTHADALYLLSDAVDSVLVLNSSAKQDEIRSFTSQLVYLDTRSSGFEITLKGGKAVTVHWNGESISAQAHGETISALLNRMQICPSPLEMIFVDLSDPDTVVLTIASDLTYYEKGSKSARYETERIPAADLPKGKEEVVQAGAFGTCTAIYEVVYSGGELVSRQLVEETDSTAVKEVIRYGTNVSSVSSDDRIASVSTNSDGSGTLTFRSGDTMRFSAAKSMTATAYTAGHGGVGTRTATGTTVCVGTVAVDPSVIPLHSKLYIVTDDGKVVYGSAVALDTGVRGDRVDLYYNSYTQCLNFGRRSCTVYLVQ